VHAIGLVFQPAGQLSTLTAKVGEKWLAPADTYAAAGFTNVSNSSIDLLSRFKFPADWSQCHLPARDPQCDADIPGQFNESLVN
jgi:hypothetical protein